MTTVELAGAYATVANNGVYRTPLYYTKITNSAGEVIYESKQEETRVFSEQTAWLLQDLMKEPVYSSVGTAGSSRISGQECRGKTGTTNNNSSASFCGYTKYYTAAVWLGFDREADGTNATNADSGLCARLYQAIMSKVHTGLPSKGWDRPSGITTAVVCSTSGKLATDECRQDPEGNKAYSEYFKAGTVPSETCNIHKKIEICNKTGKLATENCTDKTAKVFITRPDSETNQNWKSAQDAKYMAPIEVCEECKKPVVQEPEDVNNVTNGNTINNNVINNVTNTNTNKNNTNNSGATNNTVNNMTNTSTNR